MSKTVENRVLRLLRELPDTRYDDMELFRQYYRQYLPTDEMSFDEVMFAHKVMDLPCFESIRRARQRIQSCLPELSRDRTKDEEDEENRDDDDEALLIVLNFG